MATRNKGLYTRDARQKAGRITAAVFILVAAVIAVVVLRRVQGEADGRASNARRLIEAFRAGAARGYARTMSNPPLWPDASTAESAGADADADEAEPLAVDIDGDSFQDRVSIVPEKDGGAVIVFERYNGTLYTRIAEASVPIEAKTAALAAMDMTGDHKMEVV